MSQEDNDIKKMKEGISKLLGKDEYESKKAAPACIHEDDGYTYGETNTYVTLRCRKCGVYYDKKK